MCIARHQGSVSGHTSCLEVQLPRNRLVSAPRRKGRSVHLAPDDNPHQRVLPRSPFGDSVAANMSSKQSLQWISIKGARVNNLKNVSIDLPKNAFIVMTGLSGSGKSSLAFDTLHAEGQRRYMESMSSYARQFMELQDKPDVDSIEGLTPTIAIDQKSTSHNPRSTVGTVTEIYDHLRLLFSRAGRMHCSTCGKPVTEQSQQDIAARLFELVKTAPVMVLAPLVREVKGEHKVALKTCRDAGIKEVRFDGTIVDVEEMLDTRIDYCRDRRSGCCRWIA